jgi:hypothetical protein
VIEETEVVMASLFKNVARTLFFPGSFTAKTQRLRRVMRRYARYPQLRAARYPWNVFKHWLRWRLLSPQRLEARIDRQLKLEEHAWVFIAGCNNSGTTLLREVLDSHPLIRGLPREAQTLTNALPCPRRAGVPRLFGMRLDVFRWTEDSDSTPALRAKYDWSRYFPAAPGHLLVKSPENTVRTRWLQRNFSPSRFVAIIRSPYAVCEGTHRREGHSLASAAEHWVRVNECLLDDLPSLQHALLVRYEDFCQRPTEHLRRLEEFLQLSVPFSAQALKARKVHNIDNSSSGIRDFNAQSLARLSPTDREIIHGIAGPLMDRLGYERC